MIKLVINSTYEFMPKIDGKLVRLNCTEHFSGKDE